MAKASLKLPNGTVVTLEGTPEEVKRLLDMYAGEGLPAMAVEQTRQRHKMKKTRAQTGKPKAEKADLHAIVNLVKDCDEAEAIEKQILDRTSQVDRTLLALYIVHEYLDNAFGLTSGDVRKITTDLGIPMSQPNASRALSGTASKYVIGDKTKVKGQAVHYKLSRRGAKYMKDLLAVKSSG